MGIKEGYKQSDIGIIPDDWEVSPMRPLLCRAPRYGLNAPAVGYNDSLPTYIRITDISGDCRFTPHPKVSVRHLNVNDYYLSDGDLVFARTGASVGKSYRYKTSDGPLVFAGFLIQVSPDQKKLNPVFLSYYVQTGFYWNWISLMSSRTGQPGVNGREFGNLPVPLPQPPEQAAIAEALSDVDALINSLENLIAKKRAIKLGAMQQLLTGKTRLPGYSEDWRILKLSDLANITMGQSPQSKYYNDHGIGLPLIQGNADIRNRRTIARVWTLQCTKHCEKNDIILTVRAPVGAIGIASDDACLGRGVCGLQSKFDSQFLFQLLVFSESKWKVLEQGSTFTSANSTQVSEFSLYIPFDNQEQYAIGCALADMDNEIAILEQEYTKLNSLKTGMMQELLTGQTRLV